jgi:hypothetical protein
VNLMGDSSQLCADCGAIAPPPTRCPFCGSASSRVDALPLLDGLTIVASRWHTSCGGCRAPTAVNGFEDEPVVDCSNCGNRQAIAVTEVGDHLREAHYHVERGKHAMSVLDETPGSWDSPSPGSLWLRCVVGQPLCDRCKLPLALLLQKKRVVASVCAKCGDRAQYRMPSVLRQATLALRGAMHDEHRLECSAATITRDGPSSAASAQCPGCGAPLTLSAVTPFVTCGYCGVHARVPNELFRERGGARKAETIWLVFRGASEKGEAEDAEARLQAEQLKRQDEERAEQERRKQRFTALLLITIAALSALALWLMGEGIGTIALTVGICALFLLFSIPARRQ